MIVGKRTKWALVWCLMMLVLCISLSSVEGKDCSSEGTYSCPNCGGIEVSDCLDCDGHLNTNDKNDACFHRKLYDTGNEHYDYLWNDIVGMIVWFCAAGVATACGVGGGGIYVPLGIILLRFAPKPASGLSQASIFGASLGGLLLNSRNRHPNTSIRDDNNSSESKDTKYEGKLYTRPLIDYDMALFLAPMEMAGAVLGVLVQKLMPNWLYLSIAGCVLAFTSYKTYMKFFAANKKEKAERAKAMEAEDVKLENEQEITENPEESASNKVETALQAVETGIETAVVSHKESDDFMDDENVNDNVQYTDDQLDLRRQLLEEDMRQYPREKLVALLILWIGLILLTFFKGGKGVESLIGITCESPWFAVLIVFQFLWTLGFAVVFAFKLIKRQKLKDEVGYPYLENDVIWDLKKLRFYATFTFVAGIVAGLIGIGGGMVLGPLMLVMGIHPRVSSATTATMIVLTSSSVAILFVTSGLVPFSYAIAFFCICLCGAYIGKKYIDAYVKKTGRASILIGILATIILLATIGCFVIMLTRLSSKNWCLDGFKAFCDVKNDEKECAANRALAEFLSAIDMES
eukprot:CAMPEP_0185724688 /NCGR_PEP_ID=MMETSP1171-20130828/1096_1 /TAXON_ID=374046 /ORGANISM="Helicotheca tamensis, Strain CCMP826" /LENGTH=575 /DNA_ID=CAMNT_0028392599 /DNA_START=27 /DNA_END=1757 /DNA_ORIENTATION=+